MVCGGMSAMARGEDAMGIVGGMAEGGLWGFGIGGAFGIFFAVSIIVLPAEATAAGTGLLGITAVGGGAWISQAKGGKQLIARASCVAAAVVVPQIVVRFFPFPDLPTSTGTTPSVPQKARDVLDIIRNTGAAPAGYRGGRAFANDGRNGGQILPRTDGNGNPITYREWDVNPYQPGVNRGAERIVTGTDQSAYYTSDH
jgi:guanyl-specific ribonuclease Sa